MLQTQVLADHRRPRAADIRSRSWYSARQLVAAGYVNLRRPNQRKMWIFFFDFSPPIAWVPLSQERENVLPTEMLVQLVQIGSEGHRVGSPQPKQFTSGFFGKLRK